MLTVTDIMTRDVVTIRSSVKVVQAIALMQERQVPSLIVERETETGAYGILTERDIVYNVTAKCADPCKLMVGEIMTSPCTTVESNFSLPVLAKRLAETGIQRAPVVENNQLLGVVSVSDIIMKSNIEAVCLPENLSQKVEEAIRHRRLGWNEESDLVDESAAMKEVLKELQVDTVS
ncbi:MAG: CBS domain-containing protein [Phormidesmis sp.]